jgi:hypothetical protein
MRAMKMDVRYFNESVSQPTREAKFYKNTNIHEVAVSYVYAMVILARKPSDASN